MNVWTMLIFNWAEWRFLFRFLIPHWIWVLFFGMVRFLWAVLFYWKRKFVLCRWLKIFFLLVIGIEFLCQKWMAQTGTFFHDFLIFDIFQLIFWNYYKKNWPRRSAMWDQKLLCCRSFKKFLWLPDIFNIFLQQGNSKYFLLIFVPIWQCQITSTKTFFSPGLRNFLIFSH